MSDIVERLRALHVTRHPSRSVVECDEATILEAAAEIERFRAGNDDMRATLDQQVKEVGRSGAENKRLRADLAARDAEVARLRAALRPFADALKGYWSMQPGSMKIVAGPWASDLRLELTLAHFRNASYALEGAAPSAPEKEGE